MEIDKEDALHFSLIKSPLMLAWVHRSVEAYGSDQFLIFSIEQKLVFSRDPRAVWDEEYAWTV